MTPLVSVVITTYKGIETLERAIESVERQTYSNLEIIVVDDNGLGSEDQVNTYEIVKKYKNVNYIPHRINKNGSAARNTGMNAAKGKYIALLDDDDSFREEKIEKQVVLMEQKGDEYGLCYTGMAIHFPDGKEVLRETYCDGTVFEMAILRKLHAQTSEFLLRKDLALKIGGFDESFCRHQDWEFFDRMAFEYKIAVVREVCIDRYIYKRNSAKNPAKFAENRLFYLNKMKGYFNKLDKNDQKRIIAKHYSDIAKEYLKNYKPIRACSYIIRSGYPILCAKVLLGK